MKDLTIKCATTAGDSVLFRPLSELVGIRVRDCGRSDEALVDVDHEDARRLRDWLTAWLAEQEGEEPEEADDLDEEDGDDTREDIRMRVPISAWVDRLAELQSTAASAALVGNHATVSTCMAVHDWIVGMAFDDLDEDGDDE